MPVLTMFMWQHSAGDPAAIAWLGRGKGAGARLSLQEQETCWDTSGAFGGLEDLKVITQAAPHYLLSPFLLFLSPFLLFYRLPCCFLDKWSCWVASQPQIKPHYRAPETDPLVLGSCPSFPAGRAAPRGPASALTGHAGVFGVLRHPAVMSKPRAKCRAVNSVPGL